MEEKKNGFGTKKLIFRLTAREAGALDRHDSEAAGRVEEALDVLEKARKVKGVSKNVGGR